MYDEALTDLKELGTELLLWPAITLRKKKVRSQIFKSQPTKTKNTKGLV